MKLEEENFLKDLENELDQNIRDLGGLGDSRPPPFDPKQGIHGRLSQNRTIQNTSKKRKKQRSPGFKALDFDDGFEQA